MKKFLKYIIEIRLSSIISFPLNISQKYSATKKSQETLRQEKFHNQVKKLNLNWPCTDRQRSCGSKCIKLRFLQNLKNLAKFLGDL
jgi:hypothetical protein